MFREVSIRVVVFIVFIYYFLGFSFYRLVFVVFDVECTEEFLTIGFIVVFE